MAGCLGASILLLLTFPPKPLYRRISSLKQATRTAFVDNGAWRVQSVLSLMVVGSYLGLYMLASAAVGAPLPYVAAITVIPLCLLMMLVPATVAGWGAREAAAALLWPLFGYSARTALRRVSSMVRFCWWAPCPDLPLPFTCSFRPVGRGRAFITFPAGRRCLPIAKTAEVRTVA
ncbi:lysylphosphatidylglycerol synthase domain-containing protein [Rhizobium halophilum]|uniref:lysylphosphatidylglycerol synthase domain-containing protein n=1 Tax=Rhizobium halophilum TaxID=2846852 RepID=UPI00374DD71A